MIGNGFPAAVIFTAVVESLVTDVAGTVAVVFVLLLIFVVGALVEAEADEHDDDDDDDRIIVERLLADVLTKL